MNTDEILHAIKPTEVDPDRVFTDISVTLTDYRFRVPKEYRGEDDIPEESLVHVTLHVADDPEMHPRIEYAVVDSYGRVTIPDRIRDLFGLGHSDEFAVDLEGIDLEVEDARAN